MTSEENDSCSLCGGCQEVQVQDFRSQEWKSVRCPDCMDRDWSVDRAELITARETNKSLSETVDGLTEIGKGLATETKTSRETIATLTAERDEAYEDRDKSLLQTAEWGIERCDAIEKADRLGSELERYVSQWTEARETMAAQSKRLEAAEAMKLAAWAVQCENSDTERCDYCHACVAFNKADAFDAPPKETTCPKQNN